MSAYAIEKGVPLPPPASPGKADPNSVMGLLRSMDVGDSLLIDKPQKEAPVHSRILGKKFTTRKVSDNQTRIWRVA